MNGEVSSQPPSSVLLRSFIISGSQIWLRVAFRSHLCEWKWNKVDQAPTVLAQSRDLKAPNQLFHKDHIAHLETECEEVHDVVAGGGALHVPTVDAHGLDELLAPGLRAQLKLGQLQMRLRHHALHKAVELCENTKFLYSGTTNRNEKNPTR